MLRVSTTTIEQFRRVVETEYANEAELIAQVRREPFASSWQMEVGSAWDSVLNEPEKHARRHQIADGELMLWYQSGRYKFDGDAVDAAIEVLGPGLSQVKHTKVIDTRFGEVSVVGVADRIHGLLVQDNKAKFSAPDPSEYEPALQWRFYLMIFGAICFRYNLFAFKEPTDDGYCELKSIDSVRFWPYDAMEADCRGWLGAFLEWADRLNLLRYLERSGT